MVYVSFASLAANDSSSTTAITRGFAEHLTFAAFSSAETADILSRDAEDGDKLAAGVQLAVDKGVLPAKVVVEPTTAIDVMGKSADEVANAIVKKLGTAPQQGCVLVLQGLSGTGKGTTVDTLKSILPKAVTWSNGNVFRSLTLLAVTYCEQNKIEFGPDALTADVLAKCMACLSFGKHGGKFDIKISGFGLELLVSDVANTVLKEPRVGKNIPTVAKMTQGEVVKFASEAAATMGADGCNVLIEGREQTLNHVSRPPRVSVALPDVAADGAAALLSGADRPPLRAHAERPTDHRQAARGAADDGRRARHDASVRRVLPWRQRVRDARARAHEVGQVSPRGWARLGRGQCARAVCSPSRETVSPLEVFSSSLYIEQYSVASPWLWEHEWSGACTPDTDIARVERFDPTPL